MVSLKTAIFPRIYTKISPMMLLIFLLLQVSSPVILAQPTETRGERDTDGDGMPDEWEDEIGFNKTYYSDAWYDLDRDGFRNLAEYVHGTNATNNTSHPTVADEDDDDSDGICNFGEYVAGTKWNDSQDYPELTDTDGDGLTDVFELTYGSSESDTYVVGLDLNPCDPDTDHDGYQNDNTDDDGNFADGLNDEEHTVGDHILSRDSVESWMDYDDDWEIEGFNDGTEVELGSNPLVPNTWDAFWYGYNFADGEDSFGINGLHRYKGSSAGSAGADDFSEKYDSRYTFPDYLREDSGEEGYKDFEPPVSSARDGWILLRCNYVTEKSAKYDPYNPVLFEMYYNIHSSALRVYCKIIEKKDYDIGSIILKNPNNSSLFLGTGTQVIEDGGRQATINLNGEDVTGIEGGKALRGGRWIFGEFQLGFQQLPEESTFFTLTVSGTEYLNVIKNGRVVGQVLAQPDVLGEFEIPLLPSLQMKDEEVSTYANQVGIFNIVLLTQNRSGFLSVTPDKANNSFSLENGQGLEFALHINPAYQQSINKQNFSLEGNLIARKGNRTLSVGEISLRGIEGDSVIYHVTTAPFALENTNWSISLSVKCLLVYDLSQSEVSCLLETDISEILAYQSDSDNNSDTKSKEGDHGLPGFDESVVLVFFLVAFTVWNMKRRALK